MGISLGFGLGVAKAVGGAGGGSPFLPSNLGADLQLWLDAQDLTTLFTDDSETVPSANGADVGRWKDKSGNGRHADKANIGVNKPRRTDGSISTHTGVDFSWGTPIAGLLAPWVGTNPGATKITGGSRFEVWAVYTSSSAAAYVVDNDENGAYGDYWTIWTTPAAGVFVGGHHLYLKTPSGASDCGFATALGPAVVVRGIVDTTLAAGCTTISVGGVNGTMTAGYDPGLNGDSTLTSALCIGANRSGLYQNIGAMGEVVYVSRHLTPSEATGMSAYLTTRWA